VFPNPHNPPAESAQLAVHAAVAGFVRGEFFSPERTIASGNFAVLWAAMPETAVHKECQPVPSKKKIRFAENFLMPAVRETFWCDAEKDRRDAGSTS
jgi:hypothetical protein